MRCTVLFMRLLLVWLLLFTASASGAEPYRLILEGNRSAGADVYVAVYSAQAGSWDSTPILQLHEALPEAPSVTLELPLEAGAYAIRAFVDLTGDGELATGARGRPAEPFAISVGEGRRQPSTHFSRSIFRLHQSQPEVTLMLRYPQVDSEETSSDH